MSCGAIARSGEKHFVCRGSVSCKAYTVPLRNDNTTSTGSSNAFAHAVACCPGMLSHDLLLEALAQLRSKMDKTLAGLRSRALSAGAAGAGLGGFLQREARALTAPSTIMRLDMGWKEKLTTLTGVLARATAASGYSLSCV